MASNDEHRDALEKMLMHGDKREEEGDGADDGPDDRKTAGMQ